MKIVKSMQEGKRQKQVGALLEEELNHIFQRLGLSVLDGAMVSISSVKVTPDLLEARVYLSLFKAADKQASMKKIEERSWEIKKELVQSVRRQLRNMPQLSYFLDDTLDYVDKMENLFNQIKQGESAPGKKE